MALDGAFLYLTAAEIREALPDARVEKISQPSREEIVMAMRFRGGSRKLLLSANANSPRIHFTELSLENPPAPPMFCMLMRKHLNGGKLTAVRQSGLDRVLALDFETVNELGDRVVLSLVIEIMGRHSNIILIQPDGRIIDAIKRVSGEVSSVRLVLPGLHYQAPPPQEKLCLLEAGMEEIRAKMEESRSPDPSKAVLGALEGVSPLLARELVFRALKGQEIETARLSAYYKARIEEELAGLKSLLLEKNPVLTAVFSEKQNIRDFTLMDIAQYGSGVEKRVFESPSRLLDSFYADRDQQSRMKQRSHDLLKLLVNTTDRITRKLALQEEELRQCADRNRLKMYGDLLNANLYAMQKGDRSVTVQNFYEEDYPELEIKLDARLTPAQNAQKYYAEYRKAATAEEMLRELMEKSRQELDYLDSVFDAVSRTQGESELLEIREELAEQGYIRASSRRGRSVKAQPPLRYRSSDGFSILCGRNNKQNDQLTMKTAKNYDLWLHTQGLAGSHVIIQSEGREISDQAITEAAMIAAYNSKGRSSAQVAVDYTRVKYVKKPNGAKPGMVIFTDYSTAYVTPDAARVEALRVE